MSGEELKNEGTATIAANGRVDRRVGRQRHFERLHTRIAASMPLNTAVFLMPHEQKLALVKTHGWGSSGDWNNWLDPASGWNYSLHDAVFRILNMPPNAGDHAAPAGGRVD